MTFRICLIAGGGWGYLVFGVEVLSTCQQEQWWHALLGQSAREQCTCSPSGPNGDEMSASFWGSGRGGGFASKTGGGWGGGGRWLRVQGMRMGPWDRQAWPGPQLSHTLPERPSEVALPLGCCLVARGTRPPSDRGVTIALVSHRHGHRTQRGQGNAHWSGTATGGLTYDVFVCGVRV